MDDFDNGDWTKASHVLDQPENEIIWTEHQACGHKITFKANTIEELMSLRKKYSENLCEDCRKIYMTNQYLSMNQRLELKPLVGSAEQIGIAILLRGKFAVGLVDEHITEEDIMSFFAYAPRSAAWWIKHKDDIMAQYSSFVKTGSFSRD